MRQELPVDDKATLAAHAALERGFMDPLSGVSTLDNFIFTLVSRGLPADNILLA